MIGPVLIVGLALGLGAGVSLLFSRVRGLATRALILILLGFSSWAAVRIGVEMSQGTWPRPVARVGYGPWRTVHRVIPVSWEGVESLKLELAEASVELRSGPWAALAEIEAPELLHRHLKVTAQRQDKILILKTVPPPWASLGHYRLTIQVPNELAQLVSSYLESNARTRHWYQLHLRNVSIGEVVVRGGILEVSDAEIGSLSLRNTRVVRLANVKVEHLISDGTFHQFAVWDPRVPPEGAKYEIAGDNTSRYVFVFTEPFHLRLHLGPLARLETDLTPKRDRETYIFGDETLPPLELWIQAGVLEIYGVSQ